MTPRTRRSALRASIGAWMACSCAAVLARPSALSPVGLSIPQGPMRLTRTFSRGLFDGNTITVRRDWKVEFNAQGAGYVVSGMQVSASVDAPAKLERLADIERTRDTSAMFPILLALDGQILATGDLRDIESFSAALQEADQFLAQSDVSDADALQHRNYILGLQEAGGAVFESLPSDLFYPSTTPQSRQRALSLPNGESGEFEVRWSAEIEEAGGWLRRAEREVITKTAQSERRSSEVWTLAPFGSVGR